MGPLGMQEMVFIFVLALLIFGPKKLPELGKTLGKAMTEFRRASSELKSTFDREMSNLERETESHTKEISSSFNYDTYNYESSSYDSGAYGSVVPPWSAAQGRGGGIGLRADRRHKPASRPAAGRHDSAISPRSVVATC